jgi:hypothetical protein
MSTRDLAGLRFNGGKFFREGSGGNRLQGRHRSAIGGETVVDRPDGGLGAVVDVDLAQQRLEVNLHGRFRDAVFVGDHLIAGAGHQSLKDLLLAW